MRPRPHIIAAAHQLATTRPDVSDLGIPVLAALAVAAA